MQEKHQEFCGDDWSVNQFVWNMKIKTCLFIIDIYIHLYRHTVYNTSNGLLQIKWKNKITNITVLSSNYLSNYGTHPLTSLSSGDASTSPRPILSLHTVYIHIHLGHCSLLSQVIQKCTRRPSPQQLSVLLRPDTYFFFNSNTLWSNKLQKQRLTDQSSRYWESVFVPVVSHGSSKSKNKQANMAFLYVQELQNIQRFIQKFQGLCVCLSYFSVAGWGFPCCDVQCSKTQSSRLSHLFGQTKIQAPNATNASKLTSAVNSQWSWKWWWGQQPAANTQVHMSLPQVTFFPAKTHTEVFWLLCRCSGPRQGSFISKWMCTVYYIKVTLAPDIRILQR